MKTLLLFCLLAAVPCFASAKKHEFKGSMDQVFDAAVKSAQSNWSVKFVDRQTHTFSFDSGVSLTTNGMGCSVSLRQAKDGEVEVTLHTQKKLQLYAWGAGDRIAAKFFKGIEDAIASNAQGEEVQHGKSGTF